MWNTQIYFWLVVCSMIESREVIPPGQAAASPTVCGLREDMQDKREKMPCSTRVKSFAQRGSTR